MTDNGYHRWIHRFGISSSLLLFVAMTAFPVAISFVYGIWPDFKALWPGFVAVILFMAPYWPAETIGYMSVMGPGALYMSYITGNVTNLRMPATIGTINHCMWSICNYNRCDRSVGCRDCNSACTGFGISGDQACI